MKDENTKKLQIADELEIIKKSLKPLAKPKLKPIDKVDRALVICLDVSGSMADLMDNGESKLHVAWQAFKRELQPRLSGWHLGILAFGTLEAGGVQWQLPPTNQADLAYLREPAPQDGTPLLPALHQAWNWLKKRALGGRIIVISDGMPTVGGTPDEILEEAPKHGVPIDTIGVGKGCSYLDYSPQFLSKLAEVTGGCFTEVDNVASLAMTIRALSPMERPILGQPK
jgi:Mg-chelatase subunit ChlD